MAMIHCKACGRNYSYEKHGCCPSCGAYNRPPRREQVYADGAVHHLKEANRQPIPHGDKVCYERQTEQRKASGAQWVQQLWKLLSPPGPGSNDTKLILSLGAIIAVVISIVVVINIAVNSDVPEPDIPQPEPVEIQLPDRWPDAEWLGSDVWAGENWFYEEEDPDSGDRHSYFAVELWLADDEPMYGPHLPKLLYTDSTGQPLYVSLFSWEPLDTSLWLLIYETPDYSLDTETWPMLYFPDESGKVTDFCYLT